MFDHQNSCTLINYSLKYMARIGDEDEKVFSFNRRHADLNASHLLFSSEPVAPGHLPESAKCGEVPGGERGQPGAAGPGREHGAPCCLPARSERVRHRDDQRDFPEQAGAGSRDPELERWGEKPNLQFLVICVFMQLLNTTLFKTKNSCQHRCSRFADFITSWSILKCSFNLRMFLLSNKMCTCRSHLSALGSTEQAT